MTIRMAPRRRRSLALACITIALALGLCVGVARDSAAQAPPPPLTGPVNDFANAIDEPSKAAMDRTIRNLLAATGDTLIVATVQTVAPYADAKELAVKMFENRGSGIGKKGKDNGLLVLLAINERQVWVEVGYGLEEIITDGYAGDVSRQIMTPSFKRGEYGQGLRAGVDDFALHIADARGVTLDGISRSAPVRPRPSTRSTGFPSAGIIILMLLFAGVRILSWLFWPASLGRSNRWGGGGWSGWGGGGFGGGGSGGGGGGASW